MISWWTTKIETCYHIPQLESDFAALNNLRISPSKNIKHVMNCHAPVILQININICLPASFKLTLISFQTFMNFILCKIQKNILKNVSQTVSVPIEFHCIFFSFFYPYNESQWEQKLFNYIPHNILFFMFQREKKKVV